MERKNVKYFEKDTSEIKVPNKLIDQVIGQDRAVEIIKKASTQKRNVLLVGTPGTGKSMLAQAMSELLPREVLQDVLMYPNKINDTNPKVRVVNTYDNQEELNKNIPGKGRRIVESVNKMSLKSDGGSVSPYTIIGAIVIMLILAFVAYNVMGEGSANIIAAALLGILIFAAIWVFVGQLSKRMGPMQVANPPKLVVDNSFRKTAPFIEATGSKAGALFGDVKHDPLQSGGLGTPAHLRVESGAIHRANKGVLFIDEVAMLGEKSQQDLLSAMQNKKFSITGQSENSSGALVRTDPVPCDFLLVAAGNPGDVSRIHPALRSRIKGYGYEVYMEDTMEDNENNREKIVQFIAQEVKNDKKIPHFDHEAVEEIIRMAKKMAGRKSKLTLKLRDLGGLIRAAGDVAVEEKAPLVKIEHVIKAKIYSPSLEQQYAKKIIEHKKEYEIFNIDGSAIGTVNGLAVLGDASSGLILSIEAEVAPASSKNENKIIATGKLGEIAKEAVHNISAVIKKNLGKTVSNTDIHIQFLQTYEGVEGDSASVSIATAVVSALEEIPVKQNVAMTGSLSVRGEVLPVGGITAKVEAAIDAGVKTVIIPYANREDVVLSKEKLSKIELVYAKTIKDVLQYALVNSRKKTSMLKKL
jgi:ATP-dependent Lon protease